MRGHLDLCFVVVVWWAPVGQPR